MVLSLIKISGVVIKKKIRGSTVFIVVAAVASPMEISFLFKKYIWAKAPPVAKGVIFDKNILMNANLTRYSRVTFICRVFKTYKNLKASKRKYKINKMAKTNNILGDKDLNVKNDVLLLKCFCINSTDKYEVPIKIRVSIE